MDKPAEYGINQIKSLQNVDAIRQMPAMYLGNLNSTEQLVYEILDNSIDEFMAGYGNVIDVHIYKDFTVEVIDRGRGIPVGPSKIFKDKNGKPIDTLTGILTTLHSGGKYSHDKQSGYYISGGLHGIGSCATNACSNYFCAIVKRDGHIYKQEFAYGVPTSEVEVIGDTDETGTTIKYHPDKQIYKSSLEPLRLEGRLMELASLNSGLTINYINEKRKVNKSFYYKDGINGYTLQLIEKKKRLYDEPILINDKYDNIDESKILVEISFIHDNEVEPNNKIKSFVNSINTYEGGMHVQGFRNALKDYLNEYAINKKLIKEPIEMRYFEDGLYATISIKMTNAEFEGQTKTKLGNAIAKDAVEDVLKKGLEAIAKNRKQSKILDLIAERASKTKTAELAARQARLNSRKAKQLTSMALPGKLADCANHEGQSELLIVEGDSAAGTTKQGRYKEFQAVLPLRGKILNVSKADIGKILNSEIIKGIVAAIGGGIGDKFDINNIRYDKVIMLCFAGDTKVKMLDGTVKTFKELVELEKQNPGQKYWVYSCTKNGHIVPGEMYNPRIIQKTKEMIKLTLDDDSVIECTPDHKFMLRNGKYCEAKDLTSDMSLMPLYTKIIYDNGEDGTKREKLYDNEKRKWVFTHRTVMRHLDDGSHVGRNWHAHHINKNALDNRPENMTWKTPSEHATEHKDIFISYNKSEEHINRVKQLHKEGKYEHTYWQNSYNGSNEQKEMLHKLNQREDIKELHRQTILKYNKGEKNKESTRMLNKRDDVKLIQQQNKILHYLACLIRKNIPITRETLLNKNEIKKLKNEIVNVPTLQKIEKFFKSFNEAYNLAKEYEKNMLTNEMFNRLTNVKEIKKLRIKSNKKTKCGAIAKIGKTILDNGLTINEENYIKFKSISKSKAPRWENILNYYSTFNDFLEASKNYNHKIKNVEYIHYDKAIPVYCCTVKDYHNFAIVGNDERNGIFVSNCDADVDGNHIRSLLLTLFYYYMPDLIKKGHVYAAMPPLYRIVKKDTTSIYIADDNELEKYRKLHPKDNDNLYRLKGLGEMSAEELRYSTVDPKTRTLKRITIEDAEEASKTFEILMGKDAALRKSFIEENAFSADISSL